MCSPRLAGLTAPMYVLEYPQLAQLSEGFCAFWATALGKHEPSL